MPQELFYRELYLRELYLMLIMGHERESLRKIFNTGSLLTLESSYSARDAGTSLANRRE